jgi:hypothetical protein
LSSFETLILKLVLILSGSLVVHGKEENREEFQKGTFLRRLFYQDWGKTIAIISEENPPHIKAVKRPLLEAVAFITALRLVMLLGHHYNAVHQSYRLSRG